MNSAKRLSLNIARKFVITNFLQLKHNKIEEFYKKNYFDNKRNFREIHQQDLTKMKELQKFQNSTFDEFTRQKIIEDQKIIWKISRTAK